MGNKTACFVNEPSTCSDLVESRFPHGKHLSAQACIEPTKEVEVLAMKRGRICLRLGIKLSESYLERTLNI